MTTIIRWNLGRERHSERNNNESFHQSRFNVDLIQTKCSWSRYTTIQSASLNAKCTLILHTIPAQFLGILMRFSHHVELKWSTNPTNEAEGKSPISSWIIDDQDQNDGRLRLRQISFLRQMGSKTSCEADPAVALQVGLLYSHQWVAEGQMKIIKSSREKHYFQVLGAAFRLEIFYRFYRMHRSARASDKRLLPPLFHGRM